MPTHTTQPNGVHNDTTTFQFISSGYPAPPFRADCTWHHRDDEHHSGFSDRPARSGCHLYLCCGRRALFDYINQSIKWKWRNEYDSVGRWYLYTRWAIRTDRTAGDYQYADHLGRKCRNRDH